MSGHIDWAGERAARWAANWELLDRQLGPVTEHLVAAAELEPGTRVLDVGCGTGPTTRLAAAAVGRDGAVVGLDVAPEMLEVARAVPVDPAAAPIAWVLADATTWPGQGHPFDLVLSRFGVMFFADPVAAFTNLRSRARPDGRLCIATWQHRSASPMFEVPLGVVLSCCAEWGLEPEVPAPDGGPFSLHEPVLRDLLERTGWTDVVTEPMTVPLFPGGVARPAEAAAMALEAGPARDVAAVLDDEQRRLTVEAIAQAYRDHVDGDGHVRLEGGIVVARARRGGAT